MKKPSLLLVGYGRFGSFAAEILKSRFTVHILERGRPERIRPGLKRARLDDLGTFQLIVLALPAHRLEMFLKMNGKRISDRAFVADVCAVKSAPMQWFRTRLPQTVSFAGLHPLFGPESAATGHTGHSIAVCRGRSSDQCHRRLLASLKSMGLIPVETDPITHDKSMASSLFLTQFIGKCLPSLAGSDLPPLVTATFEHLRIIAVRAARNAPGLLGELHRFNPYCGKTLSTLTRHIQRNIARLNKSLL